MEKVYRRQFIILIIWIAVVMALFRFIPEKQVAALLAGAGFIALPGWFLAEETRGKRDQIHISVLLIFLLGAALPIFYLRAANWGADFAGLSFLGVSGERLHKFSNVLYLLMLASAGRAWFKARK